MPLKGQFSLDEYTIHINKFFSVHTKQEAVNLIIRASFCTELYFAGASQAVLVVKNPLANAGRCKRCGSNPWVGKISLEEGIATHSSILV